jgi:uncharacterized protein (TIGR03905 family)
MTKRIEFRTSGTCSRMIIIDVEDGVVKDCTFVGGCAGNTKGIGALVRGMRCEDVIARLEGIKCGFKNTSCPDQLARALKAECDN